MPDSGRLTLIANSDSKTTNGVATASSATRLRRNMRTTARRSSTPATSVSIGSQEELRIAVGY